MTDHIKIIALFGAGISRPEIIRAGLALPGPQGHYRLGGPPGPRVAGSLRRRRHGAAPAPALHSADS